MAFPKRLVENAEGDKLHRADPLFAATEVDAVFGSLAYTGKAKTIGAMDEAKFKEAARQLETDDDPERFKERLGKLVKRKPE